MRILGVLLVLAVLIGGAWTAFWFYAAGETGRSLEAWMAQEAAQGRRWVCPNRAVTGYPLAMDVACDLPSFAGPMLGEQAVGSLAGLTMRASLASPSHATLTLAPPFVYRTAGGQTDFSVTWSRMSVDLDGLTTQLNAGAASGTDIVVQGRFGALGAQATRAAKADVTLAASSGTADPAVDFTIAVGGAGVPVLDDVLGGVQPAELTLTGRVTHADLEDAPSPAALIERWRQRGGAITFASAQLARGPSRVDASGPLHLDDAHRIEGKLDASFTGAGPILRRYGINPNLAAAGSILNSLFGKHDAGSKPAGPDAISLPIVFRNGRLGVGPVVTPVALSPLY
ncbi:DUF2125 domain-containing protein [Beijerinckia sp. L45]|uniref:DUF2125 domain-containing protein n=1 Tax=Beijerinckia sp. L45 TaxID=1641855 RepID=UPI00131B467B|nr:DUF2125 domain-containing protein [Beijerinckia sp. L45]